jgi:glycosyltransferase involved in cell wall biosynthesis
MKIAAIVPAYNEERSIAAVVAEIALAAQGSGFRIDAVVVNDCSVDSTSSIIAGLNCIALDLPVNLGIGGAVQTGFRYAFENDYDFAVQVDGDGQHPADMIAELAKTSLKEGADVVIGSRFINREGFQSSALRRFGINYFKWLNKMIVGQSISDSTSGFRLINRKVLALVAADYPDEYPEPEAIIMYSMNKFRIVEIPVIMRERQGGTSSIGAAASVYYMFKVTLAILYTYIRMKFRK